MNHSLRLTLAALGILGIAVFAAAAPLTQDLGSGLTYYRAHHLPADLPPPDIKAGSIVLDLRNTTGGSEAATALAAWLEFRASAKRAVFVLLNQKTSRVVRSAATPDNGRAGVLTLAATGSHVSADIAVQTSAADDQRAYEALETGAKLSDLIASEPGKERHDEAELARERLAPSEPESGDDADSGSGGESKATSDDATPPPAPPTDAVLQRAVQLHRALLAMKKI